MTDGTSQFVAMFYIVWMLVSGTEGWNFHFYEDFDCFWRNNHYLCGKLKYNMPRKKNGMPFEAHPTPQKDAKGESLLYVTPQSGLKRTLHELETYFGDKYSIRSGEMTRMFEAFMEAAPIWMAEGYRIETPIGTFSAKIELKRDITNPDDIKHDDVAFKGIDFRPTKQFEKELKYAIGSDGFRYVRKPTSSRILNNLQHLEEALQKSIKANKGYTTVASFARYSHLTEHSARKQLNRWCCGDSPKLQKSRISHAHIYTEI